MTDCPNPPLITILGPTASGKTNLAVHIAEQLTAEIISADSRQVYNDMDLGTGKDLAEYGRVPYHLINVIEPNEEYSLFNFSQDFSRAFNDITLRNATPLLVGGTGMYLDSVLSRYKLTIANIDKNTREQLEKKSEVELAHILQQLKPDQHNTSDISDKKRMIRAIEITYAEQTDADEVKWPEFRPLTLGIHISRPLLKERIKARLKDRFQLGMIEEVERLQNKGVSNERIDSFGLEYRFILKFLTGELNYNDMFQKLHAAIYKFSKQQEKWFRNIEKKGSKIIWLDANDNIRQKSLDEIQRFLIH